MGSQLGVIIAGLISLSEFNSAAATKGGHPDTSYYNGFINSLPKSAISDKLEAAKYLAHSCWETVIIILLILFVICWLCLIL